MPTSSLLVPDADAWHDEEGYSPDAARALTRAYARIARARDRAAAYLWACVELAPWIDQPISLHQRMHIHFVFALGHGADGDIRLAIAWLDRALELAATLPDDSDCLELLLLRSSFHRALSKCGQAAHDLRVCLLLQQENEDENIRADMPFRFKLLAELAKFEFYCAQFRRAERHIRQAQRLMPIISVPTLESADLTWVQAHLDRMRGQPERALVSALHVADVYTREATPISRDRIHVFVAATALDLAERIPAGPAAANRTPFLRLARSHLVLTERLAREAHDQPGTVLAKIMRARYSRLAGLNQDRVMSLQQAIHTAERLEDEALFAEGFTALGAEFSALDEQASSLNCYRTALTRLEGSEIPALAIPAWRGLLRAEEHQL